MTKVKICGITTQKMAEVCVQAGADYMGLVFAKHSPRYIPPAQAKELVIIARQGGIEPVAVFQDANDEEVASVVYETGISIVQLHGGLPVLSSGLQYIIACTDSGAQIFGADFVLYDNPHPGSGVLIEHHSLKFPAHQRVFLAGGLNQNNVLSIIQRHQPYGVDVSSGVESSRGIKDATLINAFISTVKEYHHA